MPRHHVCVAIVAGSGPYGLGVAITLARFGQRALRSIRGLAERTFEGERARAHFAGQAAYSI